MAPFIQPPKVTETITISTSCTKVQQPSSLSLEHPDPPRHQQAWQSLGKFIYTC